MKSKMPTPIKVVIAGATGVTGFSVIRGLLAEEGKFEITALARPSSIQKEAWVNLANRGVSVKAVEMGEPDGQAALVDMLRGADVVISCLTLIQMKQELGLITASSKAGVGRYVPSFFGPCCPPRGVMAARDMDLVKRLYLPFTIIDVGWWYQLSLPSLPSGKIRAKEEYSTTSIIGDGSLPWALTDNRDIGKFVAKIIADPKTLNRAVFCYSEVWSQNDVFDLVEKISGESVVRKYLTKEALEKTIKDAEAEVASTNPDLKVTPAIGMAQYRYSLGIRGDDTLQHAKYLGYLLAKELYPEVITTPLEKYIRDAYSGAVKTVYA